MLRLSHQDRRKEPRASRRTIASASRAIAGWILLVCVLLSGCSGSSTPVPVFAPLREAPSRRPVILVPGITGSLLRDRETREIVWGTGYRLVSPHDGGYSVAQPIGGRPELEAFAVIEKIRLGPIEKDIYGPIARLLETNGYRRGDLNAPRRDEDLFLFPYDWRLDNELAVRLLLEKLEGLRRARGEDRLAVDLICQSNGAHICRYLVKYGDAPFAEAEAGRAAPPAAIDVVKLVLVGTSNGGSLRILRELDRGRKYISVIGRKIEPEVLFSFTAVFQDLPGYREQLFLDETGRPLDVDLYDPANWEKYGWSIYGAEARKRMARRGVAEIFGGPEQWTEHLRGALAQARRLQRLLVRDVDGFGPTRYYLLQNVYNETPDYAVLLKEDGEWKTLFTGDKKLKRRPYLHALASAPGDGHASFESQMWLSPQERAAIAARPFYVRGKHFELILDPATLRCLVEYLHDGGR
ncbi:MAG: hypothetical protein GY856_00325, partial [bacterium]|nr:hypothetical protein [bacterium]